MQNLDNIAGIILSTFSILFVLHILLVSKYQTFIYQDNLKWNILSFLLLFYDAYDFKLFKSNNYKKPVKVLYINNYSEGRFNYKLSVFKTADNMIICQIRKYTSKNTYLKTNLYTVSEKDLKVLL